MYPCPSYQILLKGNVKWMFNNCVCLYVYTYRLHHMYIFKLLLWSSNFCGHLGNMFSVLVKLQFKIHGPEKILLFLKVQQFISFNETELAPPAFCKILRSMCFSEATPPLTDFLLWNEMIINSFHVSCSTLWICNLPLPRSDIPNNSVYLWSIKLCCVQCICSMNITAYVFQNTFITKTSYITWNHTDFM